jgi:hypothetical protein
MRKNADVMPKRTDISTILIIGAGPIVIGQACEFDYSGTQAARSFFMPSVFSLSPTGRGRGEGAQRTS